MLKPYVVAACEKVIIDQQQNGVASLIALFSKMQVVLADDAPDIPANAIAPKEWAIYSLWDIEAVDVGKEFVVKTQIFYPDKTPFGIEGRVPLKINEGSDRAQAIVNILGFPLGQTGPHVVRTWVEYGDKIVVDPIEFKIELEIIKQRISDKKSTPLAL